MKAPSSIAMEENITVLCGKKKLAAMNFIYKIACFRDYVFCQWKQVRTDRAGKTRTGDIKWGRLSPVRDGTHMGHLYKQSTQG